jgi:alanyl-tRNA synthetase
MELNAAVESGALAMFGEKYDDEVRVLSIGGYAQAGERPYSVELCGGTHVERTGDIAVFSIMSEGGISAGIRRIEATTGADALAFLKGRAQVALDLSADLKVPLKDVTRKVTAIRDERKSLEKELGEAKRKLAMGGSGASAHEEIGGIKLIARIVDGVGGKELRTLVEEVRAQIGSGIAVFVATNEGKATVSIGVTDDLIDRFSAVDLVRAANEAIGGKGGGGKPFLAQAGGPAGGDMEAALQAVRDMLAS